LRQARGDVNPPPFPPPHARNAVIVARRAPQVGKLVWAKSGEHPWWPAELCLPALDDLLEALPAKSRTRQLCVLYFGETQCVCVAASRIDPDRHLDRAIVRTVVVVVVFVDVSST
jgi:hypothetical protein